jgi:pentatricopeptide repeat protein
LQWERALELLSKMRRRGIEPDVITYNGAISACEKGSQWERALELLREMRERGVEPNVVTYSAAISACEKGLQWERALELLSEMRECGVEPDVITYNAVIEACCRNAGAETETRRIYRASLDSGVRSHWKGLNVVDLHDLSVGIAKTAVAVVLEDVRSGQCTQLSRGRDLVIITGRGEHSEDSVALLKPAVLEMLAQPEYAGLGAAVDPDNEGRVRVPAARVVDWSSDERTGPADDGGEGTPEAATPSDDRGVTRSDNDENAHFAALDGVEVSVLRERLRREGQAPLATVRQADLPAEMPTTGAVKSAAVQLLLRRRLASVLAENSGERGGA